MIKNAETVKQYKILEWVQQNFEPGSVKVTFNKNDLATITDDFGGELVVGYDREIIVSDMNEVRRMSQEECS